MPSRAVALVLASKMRQASGPMVQMNLTVDEATRALSRRLADEQGWTQREVVSLALLVLEATINEMEEAVDSFNQDWMRALVEGMDVLNSLGDERA